jgi:hypothetical protein
VNLRQCIVHIETDGCTVDLSGAYCYQLPDEVITDQYLLASSEQRERGFETGANLNFKARLKDRVEFVFKGKSSRTSAAKDGQSHNTKGKRRVMLISCNGKYWVVGDDEYGDPRNPGGRLRERYFNEDHSKPLCAVDVKRGVSVAKVTVEVRAKFGHLDVDLLDEWGRPSRKARQEHIDDIARSLRDRLKGMALAKAIRKYQLEFYAELPPAEFVLEQRSLVAKMPNEAAGGDIAPIIDIGPVDPSSAARKRRAKL